MDIVFTAFAIDVIIRFYFLASAAIIPNHRLVPPKLGDSTGSQISFFAFFTKGDLCTVLARLGRPASFTSSVQFSVLVVLVVVVVVSIFVCIRNCKLNHTFVGAVVGMYVLDCLVGAHRLL